MSHITEQAAFTGVLERTPQIAPYYGEVGNAIAQLKDSMLPRSSYHIYELIHGHLSALASAGQLPSTSWETRRVRGGLVVAHQDFLAIQDEFSRLEQGEASKLPWNRETCLNAFEAYIATKKQYRERHIALFEQSLGELDKQTREVVLQEATGRFSHMMSVAEDMSIVAIPSWLDNEKLWAEMGIPTQLTDIIPPWGKIHEVGVVLASRAHRDDKPRGHDYFSYAARAVIGREVGKIEQALYRTAQHEGSHGVADATLVHLLGIHPYNPVGEGIPGSLGEDGRGLKHTALSLQDLLENPCPTDNTLRMETAYTAGAKFWDAVLLSLQHRGLSKDDAWVRVFATTLQSAATLSRDQGFLTLHDNVKVAQFLNDTLQRLALDIDALSAVYDGLNTPSS